MLLGRQFYTHFSEFFMLYEWGKEACNNTLNSAALKHVLDQKTHYDVILLEQFNTDCVLGVAHLLKSPVIGLSSCFILPWYFERTGSPIIPSHIPALFLGETDQMTLSGRLANWITFHGFNFLYKTYSIPTADQMLRSRFGNNLPSVSELAKEVSVLLVNQHFSFHGAYPLGSKVIQVGGLHIKNSTQNMELELQQFLDNAKYGVVLISWGSMIRAETMPETMLDGVLKAIRASKQRFVWKWENDTIPDKPDNLFISKWLPQREILCHPNVKVFMTHGGLMGTSETVYCGVPVIATPMYGDQFLNAAALVRRGMGIILHLEDINENNVIKSIKQVLEEKYDISNYRICSNRNNFPLLYSFMKNAKTVSESYKSRPQSALDTAVWWVEYVAQTKGAPLLKSHDIEMTWFSYHLLDIYMIVVGSISFVLYAVFLVFRSLCSPRPSKAIKSKTK